MKRISISVAILVIVSSVAQGHGFYGHDRVRHRVRWSIYAHSLIPGEFHYSPYASKYGSTGLVPYWVRYSPYAYSYKHSSGLVDDRGGSISSIYYEPCNYSYGDFAGSVNVSGHCSLSLESDTSSSVRQLTSNETRLQDLKLKTQILEQLKRQRSKAGAMDGKDVIAQYLGGQGIAFRTTRILQVEGKTISVDFLLADGNILVKYWNPLEILALEHQAEYKKKAYAEYLESWKVFCAEFQKAGGKVYQIISSDKSEISTELADFIKSPKSNPDPDEGKRTYAMDQGQTAPVGTP